MTTFKKFAVVPLAWLERFQKLQGAGSATAQSSVKTEAYVYRADIEQNAGKEIYEKQLDLIPKRSRNRRWGPTWPQTD